MSPRAELFAIVLPATLLIAALVTFTGVRDGAALDALGRPAPSALRP